MSHRATETVFAPMTRRYVGLLLPAVALATTACMRLSAPEATPSDEAEAPKLPETIAGREVTSTSTGGWIERGAVDEDAPAERAEGRRPVTTGRASAPVALDAPGDALFDTASPEPAAARPAPPPHGMSARKPKSSYAPGKRARRVAGMGGKGGGGAMEMEYRRPAPAYQPTYNPLRAGATDDNAEFAAYLAFLAGWEQQPHMNGRYQPLNVRDRRFIQVLDNDGRPLPAAKVRVTHAQSGRTVWTGMTYGDGRIAYYPAVANNNGSRLRRPSTGDLMVEARYGGAKMRMPWNGSRGEMKVVVPDARRADEAVALDVLFLIDTTGSMSDEIARIKDSLLMVTNNLRNLDVDFNLRYGAVLYRDVGDEYLTRIHPFTQNVGAFDRALKTVRADGGGDTPESLNQGLAVAVSEARWRQNAAKVVFLIADAPPHMDYSDDIPYGDSLVTAATKGIRIHSVAASGLDPIGTLVFRQVAQFSRGKFIFIEYGSTAASAARHGVTGSVSSNNLDRIIYNQIRDELNNWGRDRGQAAVAQAQ